MIEMGSYNSAVELGQEGGLTPELQSRVFRVLEDRLEAEPKILSDDSLVELTREVSEEEGLKNDIFTEPGERPKVYYRAFQNTEEVQALLKSNDIMLRPFSYAKPGQWSEEKSADLPLSYGGTKPLLARIIDTGGEFEDTGPYWGFGKNWSEAFTLDKIVLHKIGEEVKSESDLYKQVGLDAPGEEKIPQFTFVLDKLATEEAKKRQTLEEFANDAGWWDEVISRAKNFSVTADKYGEHLNQKYLEYFDQTLKLPLEKAETEKSRESLEGAKIEISRFIKRLLDTESNDKNWSPENVRSILANFSYEAWQGYFDIVVPNVLGESPSIEEKEKFFKERMEVIKEKTGKIFERMDFRL